MSIASISQNCRISPQDVNNYNNPNGLAMDIKGAFRILVDSGPPIVTTGSFFDYYIDQDTGNFYVKGTDGAWTLIYNFNTTPGTGVTTLANLGTGAFLFVPPVIGGVANLRSLVSNTGKITFLTEPNDISLGVNINKSDVGLSLVQNILNNYNSNRAPTGTDDASAGYSVGSSWWDATHDMYWICQAPNVGFAIWIPINPAPTGLTNLDNIGTGTAQVFSSITGSTAHLRSIGSSDVSVIVSQLGDTINLQVPASTLSFKDVASYNFSASTTTGFLSPSSNTAFQALWQLTPGINPRPNGGQWTVGGNPPFTSIARQFPSSNLGGTNYYLLNWTMTYVTSARPTVAAFPVNVRWQTSFSNVIIGPSTVTFFTSPNAPPGTVITANFQGTIGGTVLLFSPDPNPWSVYQVADLPLANTNQNITITYITATINQL